ncbi:MAG: NADH:ubiquinone reductase (Na(+)-transporting) subunit A [Gammaproteobacteria bacterium]|nr:NADH:ubiquinone reductase (Na(+)-transporting) subunit A [Gammaproteobacteria bacterium]
MKSKGAKFFHDKDNAASIGEHKSSGLCAILGRDFPGVSFQMLVEVGDQVKAGQAIMCDRRNPQIRFGSACSGVVSAIHRGSRRRLVSIQISNENHADAISFDIPDQLDKQSLIDLMLESGLWTAMRSRPFDVIADPDTKPEALFISAIDTRPLAANPEAILLKYSQEFSIGLRALCKLVDAPVYLCKSESQDIGQENTMRVEEVEFKGEHPAGLVGTHIKALCPIRLDGNQVWHIGYQDVISLGNLLSSGKPWNQRVISLAGSAVKNPGLITVPMGAGIDGLIDGELSTADSSRVISGSIIDGRDARGYEAFLGRFHNQLTVEKETTSTSRLGWLSRLFDTSLATDDPLIALPDLDRVAPDGILAVPLLRALMVGDVERARDLGALELVEDDLALLSYCCTSGTDYGRLLRKALNQIAGEGLATCR